jgi:hypothetical protein
MENEKAPFMPASSKYFNTQSFYSVEEFITPKKVANQTIMSK